MNYSEIKQLALDYSDREDDATANLIDSFLKVVESRVNRKLRTANQTVRSTLTMIDGQEYYGLPPDFAGMRDIEIKDSALSTSRCTVPYLSPEQMNIHSTSKSINVAYTIIGIELHTVPAQDGKLLEIVYYRKLQSLSESDNENWLSSDYPDCYVFGLLVEISAFAKDAEAASLWNKRFKEAIDEIDTEDSMDRWSGPPLQTRNG